MEKQPWQKYCEWCGSSVEDEPLCDPGTLGPGDVKEFCPVCGDHLSEGAMFCSCDKND